MLIVYTVIAICALGHISAMGILTYEQRVLIEDVEMEVIDPEYFDPETTTRFATTDNTLSTNWTIVKKFPPETIVFVTILGYSMGEYSNPTNNKMTWPFCESFQIGMAREYFISMGITSDSCPPEPGNYSQGSWKPSKGDLPNNIPDNRYLAVIDFTFEEKSLYKDKIYLEIQTF